MVKETVEVKHMKKKIMIISHAMELGGAERALLGLLYSFDYSRIDVDLFLMRHTGELLSLIPNSVNLLNEIKQYTGMEVPIKTVIQQGMLGIVLGRSYAKFKAARYKKKNKISGDNAIELEYSNKYTCCFMPDISDKEYDLVISFLTPHYYAAYKVKAKRRAAWIHSDYSMLKVDVDSELKMWDKYDFIISISEDCTNGFCSVFPSLRNKIHLIENIISPELIIRQADEYVASEEYFSGESVRLLSVGRFCWQKNFENIPDICKRIVDHGLNVKWYLIGFGSYEPLIKKKILEANMGERVIILGKKTNPYPYIKECDIYIQPSRYEGKAVAVREAQILRKPVIITDYPTADSQLRNGFDGVIVPLENSACADQIISIIRDDTLLMKLISNCTKSNYDNKKEVNKVYFLLDGIDSVGDLI